MVRLSDLSEFERDNLLGLEVPVYESTPWAAAAPLKESRVAIISTAGLQRRGDETFTNGAADYRVLPRETSSSEIYMSHVSTNFDRSGFQQDINVLFPIDRLKELAAEGAVGSVADFHYSFMGATAPELMESSAHELAGLLQRDGVNAVVLCPV